MSSMKLGSIFIGLACALSLLSATHTIAGGLGVRGGGGDICEDRIKKIRDDIKSWIYQSGAQGLTLPHGVTLDHYVGLMIEQIKTASVKCVAAGDRDYPVVIGSTPKVCKFSIDQTGSQITCDYAKFLATPEADQYVLIHHEYAGLAGIEVPNRDDSRYEVSNQISDYLEEQLVKKIAVKLAGGDLRVGSRVVIEDEQYNIKSVKITGVIAEKEILYRVWLCRLFGQFCEEHTFRRDHIQGIEVDNLNGVKKGQKAVCKDPYGSAGSTFEGTVAHIYSNGFVEIDISSKAGTSDRFNSEPLMEPVLYWSTTPGARAVPRFFGYNCHY